MSIRKRTDFTPLSSVKRSWASPSVATPTPVRREGPKGSYEVKATLNLASRDDPGAQRSRPQVRIHTDVPVGQLRAEAKYMDMSRRNITDRLDRMIEDAETEILRYYGIDRIEDPTLVSNEESVVVGRICVGEGSSSSSHDARSIPSKDNLWLESSRLTGGGARVKLAFKPTAIRGQLDVNTSLFDGALVGLKGMNSGGNTFTVSEIWLRPPMRLKTIHTSEAAAYARETQGAPITVATVCGPYTGDADLDYFRLDEWVKHLIREPVDVVVAMGPFVDLDNAILKNDFADVSAAAVLKDRVYPRFTQLLDSAPQTVLVLVPSLDEATSDYDAVPQMPRPFRYHDAARVINLPNPCTFNVNDVTLSVSSLDSLSAVRNREVLIKAPVASMLDESTTAATDSIAVTCRHLLRQRSFYPVYPADDKVNLDLVGAFDKWPGHNLLAPGSLGKVRAEGDEMHIVNVSPDLLITPSRLAPLAKIVDSTVVVNPGLLVGQGRGSFARIRVYPKPVPAEAAFVPSAVYERCRVDLVEV